MDAFTYFFRELALWNILLATLAFLFGLLMGYWMWGQFKKKLAESQASLQSNAQEVQSLVEEATLLRETNRELEDERNADQKELSKKLKTCRQALQEKEELAKELSTERDALKEKFEQLEETHSLLEASQKDLEGERDQALSLNKKVGKELSEVQDKDEKLLKDFELLKNDLSREKLEGASLREVIAVLNDSENELKAKLERQESELEDLKEQNKKKPKD